MISNTGSNAVRRAVIEKHIDGQKFIHIQNKYAKDYFLEENKDA